MTGHHRGCAAHTVAYYFFDTDLALPDGWRRMVKNAPAKLTAKNPTAPNDMFTVAVAAKLKMQYGITKITWLDTVFSKSI